MQERTKDIKTKEKAGEGLRNSQMQDSAGKIIFGDPILCSQFLRGYTQIPLLENVQAEDIEDVTSRFVHMFTEERDSDVVKRVHIKDDEIPFYLISLIEHKSYVDYNVIIQILRYMVYIWEDYEKEQEKKQAGISKTKGFKYPPVLPIIYYNGVDNWTAATRLSERVYLSDVLGEYIPNFKCIMVQLKDYSKEELLNKKDELSIILMINKLYEAADFTTMEDNITAEYVEEVIAKTPEYLLDTISHIIEILLSKLNVPKEEVRTFVDRIKERSMGDFFAHFKGYDVQAVRQEVREEGIEKFIKGAKRLSATREMVKDSLMQEYELEEDIAEEKILKYWT